MIINTELIETNGSLNPQAAVLNLTFTQGEPTDYLLIFTEWDGMTGLELSQCRMQGTVAGVSDEEQRWEIQTLATEGIPEQWSISFPDDLEPGRYVYELWGDWGDIGRVMLVQGGLTVERSITKFEEAGGGEQRELRVRVSASVGSAVKVYASAVGFVGASMNRAQKYAEEAEKSAKASAASAKEAQASEDAARASEEAADESEAAAKESETKAKKSEEAALASEGKAKKSEEAALASEGKAKESETKAKKSEESAAASEAAALASETNADESEAEAKAAAERAAASQGVAEQKATEADTSMQAAQAAQAAAEAARDAALESETNAAASEEAARNSENAAAASEEAAKLSEESAAASAESAAAAVQGVIDDALQSLQATVKDVAQAAAEEEVGKYAYSKAETDAKFEAEEERCNTQLAEAEARAAKDAQSKADAAKAGAEKTAQEALEAAKGELEGKMAEEKAALEGKIGEASSAAQEALDAAKAEITEDINTKISGTYRPKGNLATKAELPEEAAPWDVYRVEEEDGQEYYRTDDGKWEPLGNNLANYATKAELTEAGSASEKKLAEEKAALEGKITSVQEEAAGNLDAAMEELRKEMGRGDYSDSGAIVYEYVIDPVNPDPFSRVSYPAGSMNEHFTPAGMDFAIDKFFYGDWKDAFFMPKPCLVGFEGDVKYYLNPNNYKQKADGTDVSAEVTSLETDGNVMVEFPQVWLKFEQEGRFQHVYVANKNAGEGFHAWNFYNGQKELNDHVYLSAYFSSNDSTVKGTADAHVMRSLSGTTAWEELSIPNAQLQVDNLNALVKGGKAAWGLLDWASYSMLIHLGVLMGRSTDTAAVFGYGYYDSFVKETGRCDTDGMFYGKSANERMKFFGMEHILGSYSIPTLGCYHNENRIKIKMTESTLDGTTIEGYPTDGSVTGTAGCLDPFPPGQTLGAGFTAYWHLNEHCMLPMLAKYDQIGGTNRTFYCDYVYTDSNAAVAGWGDDGNGSWNVGLFAVTFYYGSSGGQQQSSGFKLMMKPGKPVKWVPPAA